MPAKADPAIDHGQPYDWGKASQAYVLYRDIYPEEFYQKFLSLGICRKGQKVLDLGTGTGVLPRHMARHGALFTGLDLSESQIAQARRLTAEAGLDIPYVAASAEEAAFPDGSFDVVTACQCFIYFDKERALPNIHRMLAAHGRFAVASMGWLPDESDVARASERLVLRYNPAWTGGGMKRHPKGPEWPGGLFAPAAATTFDVPVRFTRETWHGRMLACRGIGASALSESQIAAFEAEHRAFLASQPETFDVPHFAAIWVARKK